MTALLALSRIIDRINETLGRYSAWLLFAAVVISAGNAVIRKSFNISSNAWLEAQWYLFGAVFMICAAWTLKADEHVRVDVLSQRMSPRIRVLVDLICHVVFLMPFVGLMVWLAWPFFMTSFASGEASSNAGGLIRWPAKLWVLVGFVLLVFQGLSEIIKKIAMLRGEIALPDHRAGADPVAEEAASGGDLQ